MVSSRSATRRKQIMLSKEMGILKKAWREQSSVIAQCGWRHRQQAAQRLQATTTTINRVTIRGQRASSYNLKSCWHCCGSALYDAQLKSFLFHEELCAPSSSLGLNKPSRQQQVSALQAFCVLSRFPFIPERKDSKQRREAVALKSNLNLLNEAKGSLQRQRTLTGVHKHSDSSSDSGSHVVQYFALYFPSFMIDAGFLPCENSFCSVHRRRLTWSAFLELRSLP